MAAGAALSTAAGAALAAAGGRDFAALLRGRCGDGLRARPGRVRVRVWVRARVSIDCMPGLGGVWGERCAVRVSARSRDSAPLTH